MSITIVQYSSLSSFQPSQSGLYSGTLGRNSNNITYKINREIINKTTTRQFDLHIL